MSLEGLTPYHIDTGEPSTQSRGPGMEANILNRVGHAFQGCSEEEVIVGTEMVMMVMMMVYNQLLFTILELPLPTP